MLHSPSKKCSVPDEQAFNPLKVKSSDQTKICRLPNRRCRISAGCNTRSFLFARLAQRVILSLYSTISNLFRHITSYYSLFIVFSSTNHAMDTLDDAQGG